MKHPIAVALLLTVLLPSNSQAQTRPMFPQVGELVISYKHFNDEGIHDATTAVTLRNVWGNMDNGGLDMVYNSVDKDGKPYFEGNNEFIMKVERVSGQTNIEMDKMSKTMKIMNLIMVGDVSALRVPMTVGEELPDSQIFSKLGIFNATLFISEKKVMDHKVLTIGGKDYDCWLIHEKVLTKTPFSTDTDIADTWYAEGVGCVKQTIYNAKGKLKGKNELISIEKKVD